MSQPTLKDVSLQEENVTDRLTKMFRQGVRKLIAKAVEAEFISMLEKSQHDGLSAAVRNSYLPSRTIQAGIGDIEGRVPKVRDRRGSGFKFNSSLLPPYLKRAASITELLPWLYLKGISSGGCQEALSKLLGEQAKWLSANTISRLKNSGLKNITAGTDET